MKLDQAARLLDIKPESSLEEIKSVYRSIATELFPDNVSHQVPYTTVMSHRTTQLAEEDDREKFRLLAVAFTKLVSKKVLNKDEGDLEFSSDDDVEEEEDVHEMRAFMRMFMDLVGIFNEDRQNYSSGKNIADS